MFAQLLRSVDGSALDCVLPSLAEEYTTEFNIRLINLILTEPYGSSSLIAQLLTYAPHSCVIAGSRTDRVTSARLKARLVFMTEGGEMPF